MKHLKQLLVFSLFFIDAIGFSQMLNKNYVWNDLELIVATCKSTECPESYLRYYHFYHIGNDTIINNKTYSILIDTLRLHRSNSVDIVSGSVVGFIREEVALKKVYFLDIRSNEEMLLYDFSLTDGSHLIFHLRSYTSYYTVSVDSIYNLCIKRLRVTLYNYYSPSLEWIEGIGSLDGFLYPNIMNGALISVKENNDTLYSKNDDNLFGDGCPNIENILPIEELSAQTGLTIFPNPATDYVTVQQNEIINSIEILDLCGHKLAQYQPDRNSFYISLKNFKSGMYFMKVGSVLKKFIIK
jgi:hypothetical protein